MHRTEQTIRLALKAVIAVCSMLIFLKSIEQSHDSAWFEMRLNASEAKLVECRRNQELTNER